VGTGALARPVEQSSTYWQPFYAQLSAQGRAAIAEAANRRYWVAAERREAFSKLFPDATFETAAPKLVADLSFDDALLACVTGWMSHIGPVTATELSNLLGVPATELEKALLRMEASGAILRGKFTDSVARTCPERSRMGPSPAKPFGPTLRIGYSTRSGE